MPWKPGESGNNKGRPPKPEIELVRQAMEETSKEKKKSLWKHLIERSYEDDQVLIAVAKKFLPDKIAADVIDKGRLVLVFPEKEKDAGSK